MLEWPALISGALSGGLIAGVVSLLAPGVQFRMDKAKGALQAKRALIEKIRNQSSSMSRVEFRKTNEFQQIKDFLSERTILEINKPSNQFNVVMDGGGSEIVDFGMKMLVEDLAKIERKWDLI